MIQKAFLISERKFEKQKKNEMKKVAKKKKL